MESISKKVILDFEQIFDFPSLLFCVARQVVVNSKGAKVTNKEYELILN
jgi:hypothetical protein